MTSTRSQRIHTNSKTIWGDADYDLEIENDSETYAAVVRKEYETEYGPALIMTGICSSEEQALRELDRMLDGLARQVRSGQEVTKAQKLEVFGGPNGRDQHILEQFLDKVEEKGVLL